MSRIRRACGRLQVDVVDFSAAVARIIDLARSPGASYVVTPNADHVVRAESDDTYVAVCNAADLVCADGMPLVWASHFDGGEPLPSRVTGSDLMPVLCEVAAKEKLSVFILGGDVGEAELCAAKLKEASPDLIIAGVRYPPFGFEKDEAECRSIVDQINASGARLVFVGVGSPKQELWIARWRPELKQGVLLGIGMAIAFTAGTRWRAPAVMQKTGTEWLFRLLQEPRRLVGRYLKDFAVFKIMLRRRDKTSSV